MAELSGLPPGLQGWVLADMLRAQQQEQGMKQQQVQMQMQAQQAQMQEAQRKRMQEQQLREAIARAGNDPMAIAQAALQAGDVKTFLEIQKMVREGGRADAAAAHQRAQTGEITDRRDALAKIGQLMTPQGYGQQPPGTSLPNAVAPNDAQAIAMLQSAGNQPMTVGVPNQANLQGLMARAAPQQFVTQAMRPQPAGATTPLAKLIQERASLPAGDPRIKVYDDAIAKASTHQAPVNVYSGSLTAGVDAQGRPIFVQPSGQPGVPPRAVEGVYPPPRPTDRKSENEQREAELTVQGVRTRIARLSQLVQQNPTAVGLAGGVRRMGEMAAGVAESLGGPSVPTPAIDFENEQALLLSDVRKLVEKDPNLSKDERERLYQTLGGGLRQTPSSALRAMDNILGFVERKKLTGPSRERALERRSPAIGTVQGGYRFKGGDPAQQENWEKVP